MPFTADGQLFREATGSVSSLGSCHHLVVHHGGSFTVPRSISAWVKPFVKFNFTKGLVPKIHAFEFNLSTCVVGYTLVCNLAIRVSAPYMIASRQIKIVEQILLVT
jgi:hypothetical protein